MDEKSCVISLLCDPGWYVHKSDVQNKWMTTHTQTYMYHCRFLLLGRVRCTLYVFRPDDVFYSPAFFFLSVSSSSLFLPLSSCLDDLLLFICLPFLRSLLRRRLFSRIMWRLLLVSFAPVCLFVSCFLYGVYFVLGCLSCVPSWRRCALQATLSEMHTQSCGRQGWPAGVCGCKLVMILKGAA